MKCKVSISTKQKQKAKKKNPTGYFFFGTPKMRDMGTNKNNLGARGSCRV